MSQVPTAPARAAADPPAVVHTPSFLLRCSAAPHVAWVPQPPHQPPTTNHQPPDDEVDELTFRFDEDLGTSQRGEHGREDAARPTNPMGRSMLCDPRGGGHRVGGAASSKGLKRKAGPSSGGRDGPSSGGVDENNPCFSLSPPTRLYMRKAGRYGSFGGGGGGGSGSGGGALSGVNSMLPPPSPASSYGSLYSSHLGSPSPSPSPFASPSPSPSPMGRGSFLGESPPAIACVAYAQKSRAAASAAAAPEHQPLPPPPPPPVGRSNTPPAPNLMLGLLATERDDGMGAGTGCHPRNTKRQACGGDAAAATALPLQWGTDIIAQGGSAGHNLDDAQAAAATAQMLQRLRVASPRLEFGQQSHKA